MTDLLKLSAFDADDLVVISTHMQDALVNVSDITYLPKARRFALVANRFDWLDALGKKKGFRRRRAGLHFDRVTAVRSQNIKQTVKDAVLELLSISYSPTEEPSGTVILNFAAGGAIEIDVECIDCGLSDLGPEWGARSKPGHELDEETA
ncbi:MAG: DUF2948 family protein [Hyphomicrobiales bacterium]